MADTATLIRETAAQASEHFDVLVVGAGVSGVGAAYHLRTQRPGSSFVVLEAKETFGGTWITHTYPASDRIATSTRSVTVSSRGRARQSRPPQRS